MVVMAVDNPQAVTEVMPHAARVRMRGQELVVVKHDLDATKVLRNLGIAAASPMLHDGYNWSGMFTPMNHQVTTADFITMNNKLFVLNATGTGKTASAIWAADYLIQRGLVKRVLVICPVSVVSVWEEQLFSVAPHISTATLMGSKDRRRKMLATGATFNLINFDGVSSFHKNDKKRRKRSSELSNLFDLIIVDEASAYRNVATDRYDALDYLNTPLTRLWLMTGTPMSNGPADSFALIKLVNPGQLPDSFTLFKETVMLKVSKFKWVPRPGWKDKVSSLMQPAIRYEKKDCIDLPPITYNTRACGLSDEQQEAFGRIQRTAKHESEHQTVTAPNAAVKLIKLQQVCCGVVKDDDGNAVYLNPTERLEATAQIVREAANKVIVYVPFIFAMHMVQDYLEKQGFTTSLVNGSVSANERKEIFRAFQHDESPQVLIAHPAVAAHGLTLTAADTICWYAGTFSLEQYEQANARIERQGQVNAMSVYHLIGHPMEKDLYAALARKSDIQATLLKMYSRYVEGAPGA